MNRRTFLASAAALPAGVALGQAPAGDPLPSWNECPAKAAILEFVARTTTPGRDFVPVPERIAVFDNDGTLWPEDPLPFEVMFAFDRIKSGAAKRPEWREKQPFKAVVENDLAGLGLQGRSALIELILATHAGMTTDEFDTDVRQWLATARHPRWQLPYTDLTYKPMQEVLALMRAREYKTFIVSGGGAEFMRIWSEKTYGIPPQQVVGTLFKLKYELAGHKPVLRILRDVSFVDDKDGKPVGIAQLIGRRPVACFGNSDGDKEMLEWTTIGRSPSFGLIVHHTDAVREYAYDAHPKSSGKLVLALEEAPKRGWTVVDMKKDWKRVFAFE